MDTLYMYYDPLDQLPYYSGSRSLMIGVDRYKMKYFWDDAEYRTYCSSDPLGLWFRLTKLKKR